MAYPQFYYGSYPNQGQQVPQGMPQQAMPQNNMNNPMPIQSSGFVSVRNEFEARNYPVGYGNSVTFKDENAPYVYTKTMGFSQLETPRFEKYKLVKEEPQAAQEESSTNKQDNLPVYAEKSEIEAIWREIDLIKKSIPKKKKEVIEDDE